MTITVLVPETPLPLVLVLVVRLYIVHFYQGAKIVGCQWSVNAYKSIPNQVALEVFGVLTGRLKESYQVGRGSPFVWNQRTVPRVGLDIHKFKIYQARHG